MLNGYSFFFKPRSKVSKSSGGLAIAFKNNLEDNIEYIITESKFVLWRNKAKVIRFTHNPISMNKIKKRFLNQLITFCKENYFSIMNWRTLGDIEGQFTC